MQEIKTTCDLCHRPTAGSTEVRVNNKLHDLCDTCTANLTKLLQGTGREVKDIVPQISDLDYIKLFGDQNKKSQGVWDTSFIPTPWTYVEPPTPYAGGNLDPNMFPNVVYGTTPLGGVGLSAFSSPAADSPISSSMNSVSINSLMSTYLAGVMAADDESFLSEQMKLKEVRDGITG